MALMKPARPPNPMVEKSPRAFRVLVFLTRMASSLMFWGFLGCLVSIFIVGGSERVAFYGVLGAVAAIAIGLILLVCRWFVIAFFFSRFSLTHVMQFNFALAVVGSFAAILPGYWCIIPLIALFALVVAAASFLIAQDPVGLNMVPAFVNRTLTEKRRVQRQKELQQSELDSKTGTTTDGEVH